MSTLTISTTQNIELEYDLASLGERLLAGGLDLVIMIGYMILLGVFFSAISINGSLNWLVIVLYLPLVFYSLLSEVFINGQTVGKRVLGIRVASINGDQVRFGQYLIRWLFRLIDVWIFFFLVAIISIALTDKQQRLGDMIAGTTLVKTKPRASLQQTMYVPTVEASYIVTYPQAANLSDGDMQVIKEVLIAVQRTGNTMLALEAARKIEVVLGIRSQSEPRHFLYTLLADHNHLTSKL